MRTFRRALCLVMAMLFVLGLCTVANAAIYSDDAKINYKDAVTVMTGLGIIQGDDNDRDGKMDFRPTDNVTRAEACKMIAYMMLGAANAEKIPGGTGGFSDVAADYWAAKYISFCASKGIIKGMGDGTFAPKANVTGTQLATMLLRACGYGVMGEYEGKGWDVNAVTDALTEGIFEDAEVEDFSKPATREETALYVFNTLKGVDQVGYDVDLNFYAYKTDTFGEKVWDLAESNDEYKVPVQIMANQASGEDYTVIDKGLGKKNIKNIKLETGKALIGHQVNIYYRAVEKTDAEGNDYYVAYLADDLSSVVKTGGSQANFYKALVAANKDNKNVDPADVETWVNYDYTDYIATKGMEIKGVATVADMKGYNTKQTGLGGELVLDKDGAPLVYLKVEYTVDQVKAIDEEEGTIELKTDGKKGEYLLKYAYEGIKKGDNVTVTPVGKIYNIEPTTTAKADIFEATALNETRFTYNNGAYYSGRYYDGDCSGLVKSKNVVGFGTVKAGFTVQFYLDSYGAAFAVEVLEEGDYAGQVFVVRAYKVDGTTDEFGDKGADTYKVQCINEAGEKLIYVLDTSANTLNKDFITYSGKTPTAVKTTQGVFRLTLNKDKARLAPAADDLGELEKTKNKTSYLKSAAGDMYYVTSDTSIFFVKGSGNKLTVTAASKLTDTYTAIFGTFNNRTNDLKTVWVTDGKAADETVASSYMFLADTDIDGYQLVAGKEVPYYKVWIDGTVEAKALIPVEPTAAGFYTYSKDANNQYTLKAATGATSVTLVAGDIHDGKFFKTADGVSISSLKVVNTTRATTKDGKDYLAINSVEDLEGLLDEGYEFTAEYIAKKSGSNTTPNGVIYITAKAADPA